MGGALGTGGIRFLLSVVLRGFSGFAGHLFRRFGAQRVGGARVVQLVPIGSASLGSRSLLIAGRVGDGFLVVRGVRFLYVGLQRRVGYDLQFCYTSSQGVHRDLMGVFALLMGASAQGGVVVCALISTRDYLCGKLYQGIETGARIKGRLSSFSVISYGVFVSAWSRPSSARSNSRVKLKRSTRYRTRRVQYREDGEGVLFSVRGGAVVGLVERGSRLILSYRVCGLLRCFLQVGDANQVI